VALENIPFNYPWVFYFDADERITPELAASLQKVIQNPGDAVAFRVQRRDLFLGQWLKHVQMMIGHARRSTDGLGLIDSGRRRKCEKN